MSGRFNLGAKIRLMTFTDYAFDSPSVYPLVSQEIVELTGMSSRIAIMGKSGQNHYGTVHVNVAEMKQSN